MLEWALENKEIAEVLVGSLMSLYVYDVVVVNIIYKFNETQCNSHKCSPFHIEMTSVSLEPGV